MNKKQIFLSLAFATAITACQRQEDQWIPGTTAKGMARDTVRNGKAYRHYNGSWYPLYHGMISPSTYQGASSAEISRAGYTPTRISSFSHSSSSIHSGGFGSSSHASFGS
jgi:hypothetical protein